MPPAVAQRADLHRRVDPLGGRFLYLKVVASRLRSGAIVLFVPVAFRARVAQWQRSRFVIGRLAGSNPLSGSTSQPFGWAAIPETGQPTGVGGGEERAVTDDRER